MLPALSEKLKQHPELHVNLLQGVQYRQDVLYAEDFLRWQSQLANQLSYWVYLSREDLTQTRRPHERSGYVQSAFEGVTLNPQEEVVYLCGNPNMIDQTFARLQALNFSTSQVRREKYISSK